MRLRTTARGRGWAAVDGAWAKTIPAASAATTESLIRCRYIGGIILNPKLRRWLRRRFGGPLRKSRLKGGCGQDCPPHKESPQECGDGSLRGCATEAVVNFSVHILLVDDDAELCSLLGEFLRREGFTVECEHEGYRGLEKARGAGVDLVVLDVMLPGIDGFEILRRPGPAGKVPGMMLTGP